MVNAKYKELSDLLGKPKTLQTGFSLGGPYASHVFDLNKWRPTDYCVGGPLRNTLMNAEGREIARLGGPLRSWFMIDGKHTGYFLGGAFGRMIMYEKCRDEFAQR